MVTLCWHCEQRECSASFNTIKGAHNCAAILQTRDKIHDHRIASIESTSRFLHSARASNGDGQPDEA